MIIIALLTLPVVALSAPVDSQINKITDEIGQKKEQSKDASETLSALEADLSTLMQDYQGAYGKLQEIDESIAKKQQELNSATRQQIFYQKILNKLSVFAYRDGDVYFFEVVLGTRSFQDLIVRLDYLAKLSQRQAEVLSASKHLRETIKENRDQLQAEKEQQKQIVLSLQDKQDEINRLLTEQQNFLTSLGDDIKNLEADKAKKKKEKELAIAKARQAAKIPANTKIEFTFPIPQPHAHGYVNDWGFARAGNRAGHQGTDIFAVRGTPLVAAADGIIGENFGYLRIGGYRLHVIADNGVDYYYAHLNNDTPGTDDGKGGASTAYAAGIAPGTIVKRGQLIGFVGDSGDAETTPPHLHFGITVGKSWVNPFPYLRASDWK